MKDSREAVLFSLNRAARLLKKARGSYIMSVNEDNVWIRSAGGKEPDSLMQYLLTERAHLMCPNMCFGILFSLGGAYDRAKAEAVLQALSAAHPFLRAVIGDADGKPYYMTKDELQIPLKEGSSAQDDYLKILANGWDARAECLLKVFAYPKPDGFDILFAAHHLLCDGRGLLGLAAEFADSYTLGKAPARADERLIASLSDLPQGSGLPLISRLVVGSANRQWKKENHRVRYDEYLAFEREYTQKHAPRMTVQTVSNEEMAKRADFCRQNGVTINDYLIADMMRTEKARKVVIGADIRRAFSAYQPGSLGNYSTAFSVASRERSDDLAALAKDVSLSVRKARENPKRLMLVLACYLAMAPGLIDAAAISTLGEFPSKAGRFVGGGMFGFQAGDGLSVTNLGKMESDTILSAVFIPPASPANRKTVGALTVNGTMKLCEMTAAK